VTTVCLFFSLCCFLVWKCALIMSTLEVTHMLLVDVVLHRLHSSGVSTSGLNQLMSQQSELECRVLQAMKQLCLELDHNHKEKFTNMLNQLHLMPDTLPDQLSNVMALLFQDQINWGRIAALFTFTAILAQRCVEKEMPQLVSKIIEQVALYIDTHIQSWITENDGWGSLVTMSDSSRSRDVTWPSFRNICGYAAGAVGMFTLALLIAPKV
jgi:BCL2-like 1 (apoptosis regulator Bcl-X)